LKDQRRRTTSDLETGTKSTQFLERKRLTESTEEIGMTIFLAMMAMIPSKEATDMTGSAVEKVTTEFPEAVETIVSMAVLVMTDSTAIAIMM
jgi:hypothetical protein